MIPLERMLTGRIMRTPSSTVARSSSVSVGTRAGGTAATLYMVFGEIFIVSHIGKSYRRTTFITNGGGPFAIGAYIPPAAGTNRTRDDTRPGRRSPSRTAG